MRVPVGRTLWEKAIAKAMQSFFAARYPTSLRPRQVAPVLLVLGMAASIIVGAFWSPAFLVPLIYAGLLLVVGAAAIPSAGVASFGVPLALLTMHLAWGTGFLFGHTDIAESAH